MNSKTTYSGIGFSGLLTIVFIVLKLIGKISGRGIGVLSPIWINLCIAVLIVVLYCGLFKKL